nr:hypothetical protein [Micromonospora sp. A200]
MRHSFVSLLSDNGRSLEQIADLCGHSGTTVTESVYRHQLRPVLLSGADAMDRIFDAEAQSLSQSRKVRQKGRLELPRWPLTCVGTAGFEPTTP